MVSPGRCDSLNLLAGAEKVRQRRSRFTQRLDVEEKSFGGRKHFREFFVPQDPLQGRTATQSAVRTSSPLRSLRPCLGEGASLGEEAVLADSGRVGEVTAEVGRVRSLAFLNGLRTVREPPTTPLLPMLPSFLNYFSTPSDSA